MSDGWFFVALMLVFLGAWFVIWVAEEAEREKARHAAQERLRREFPR